MLNAATNPSSALPLFERICREYPDTCVAAFAEFRRAETLVFLGECQVFRKVSTMVQGDVPGQARPGSSECVESGPCPAC